MPQLREHIALDNVSDSGGNQSRQLVHRDKTAWAWDTWPAGTYGSTTASIGKKKNNKAKVRISQVCNVI